MFMNHIFAVLPMGDDFPTGMFVIIGLVALGLCIGSVMLGKKTKK